jgi:NAD(P)-dependent dehydrogenase (short-subunit alcohol dehydrogenase family)
VNKPLADCAVVISGGTSGVGLAAAQAFGAVGVRRLAVIGRNRHRGAAAVDSICRAHPGAAAHFISADVNDPAAAAAAINAAFTQLGGLDVLINSTPGSHPPALLKDLPIEQIPAALMNQALGPLLMSRAALPLMGEQQFGVIVNVASDAAKVPTPGETVIGAAMAAIVTFSRTLAVEAKRHGIRVNAVTPSLIADTRTGGRVLAGGFSKNLFEKAAARAHLGVPDARDIAELLVFLAGPGAARMTGQVISVNGGISVA